MAHHLKRRTTNRISIGTPKDICMLMWIAQQKGFLSDQKLNIKFDMVPYSRAALDNLIAGKIDCAILVETNVAYLGYLAPKIPIKCVASVETRTADSLLMRKENQTPQDILGKKVGFTPRTTSHSFLLRFLEEHKISKSDIILKPLSPQSIGDALIRGDVDAISSWTPYIPNVIHAMRELGLLFTHFENTGFYASEVVLATTKPFLIKNRKSLGKIISALKKSEEYIKNSPKESLDILGQKMNISQSMKSTLLNQFHPRIAPLTDQYIKNINLIARSIQENDTQFARNPMPNYSDVIDNSLFLDKEAQDKI